MLDKIARVAVVIGVWVAVSTEVLGLFGALRPAPLAAAWAGFFAAAVVFGWRSRKMLRFQICRPKPFELAVILSTLIILSTLFYIAIQYPPNSTDAMAYHLPRVIYWVQSATVSFFPTPYLNQISLQPLAEYFVLHSFILSGGDSWANLVQWFGFAGCIVMCTLIAKELGVGSRGRALTALFAATLPNAVLQATGAKNELLMTFWLSAMIYFLLRKEVGWSSWALALALFTKATAYLFAPVLVLACLTRKSMSVRNLEVACAAVLVINGPLYMRNFALSGSPLGYDSAQGDGLYRWGNDKIGGKQMASNFLRHASDQLGGRSPAWNHFVYSTVLNIHSFIGVNPDGPATTFPGAHFQLPLNANHESNANNRWHLLILVFCVWSRRHWRYAAGLAGAFLLFCAYLKWQMFMGRLLTPLFLLAAPLAGAKGERLPFGSLQAALCLFLLSGARLPVTENWVRPLTTQSREAGYFNDMGTWNNAETYRKTVSLLAASSCNIIGLDINHLQLEYPLQALLRRRKPTVHFVHTGVINASARFQGETPCALVCLDCSGDPVKEAEYAAFGPKAQVDRFLVYSR